MSPPHCRLDLDSRRDGGGPRRSHSPCGADGGAVAGDRPRSGPAARARARRVPLGARACGSARLHPGGALRRLLRRAPGPRRLHRGCALLRELGRRRRDPLPERRAGPRPGVRALRGRALPRPPAGGRQAAARACPLGRQAAGRRPEAVRAGGGEPVRGRTVARPAPAPARRGRPCARTGDGALGRKGRAGRRGRGGDLAAAADRPRRARLRRGRPRARSRRRGRGAQQAPRARLRPTGRRRGRSPSPRRSCALRTLPDAFGRVIDAEPEPVATISRAGIDVVARAFGEFVDLKLGVPDRALEPGGRARGDRRRRRSAARVPRSRRSGPRASSTTSAAWPCRTASGTSPAR